MQHPLSNCIRFGLALSLAFYALGPATALAEPYRLAVLELDSDNVHDQLANRLTERLRTALAQRSGYAMENAQVSLAQLSLAQDCGTASSDCLAKIARELKLDGFVFGTVTHDGGSPVALLRRYDVHGERVDRSALFTFNPTGTNDEELASGVERLLDDLLGNAHKLTQSLLKLPAPPPAAGASANTSSSSSARTVVGYILLGTALASAGMAGLSFYEIHSAQSSAAFTNYRYAVGEMKMGVSQVCDEAEAGRSYGLDAAAFRSVRSSCSVGNTFEVLQYVFIGAAIATGGVGMYLLLSGGAAKPERAESRRALSLQPSIDRRNLGLSARLAF